MSRSEHARLHGKEYGFSEKARAARVKKIKEEGHPKLRKLSNDDVRAIFVKIIFLEIRNSVNEHWLENMVWVIHHLTE